MMINSTPDALSEPGTYVIVADGKDVTVEADRLDYNGPDGSLQAWKGDSIVATFRWWSSIVRKQK